MKRNNSTKKVLGLKLSVWLMLILGLSLILLVVRYNIQKDPIITLLEDAGAVMKSPPKEYGKKYANTLVNTLLTENEIKKITASSARIGNVDATLWDWGERGIILSYSKELDLNTGSILDILIDRPESIKLRHKIKIGTDMVNWELIKKESNFPAEKPFKRTYLLIQKRGENGRMVGLAFFEGSMVEIEIYGKVDNQSIANLENVTWEVSQRLEGIYEKQIKGVAEGPLFENDPILSRPDLPDPDLQ